jgi:membrane protein DedA with SNARE-associated domain
MSMVIENLGIPFPVEAGYLAACALIKHGYSYGFFLGLITAGHMVGSIAAYLVGGWGENFLSGRILNKKYLKASKWLNQWYSKYGILTVFLARFVGYVRPWSSLAAGFSHLAFPAFLFWTFAGTVLFNLIVFEITIRFLALYHTFRSYSQWAAILLAVVSIAVLFIGRYLLRDNDQE